MRPARSGRSQGRGRALAQVWQRHGRVGRVDLAGQAVAVPDRIGQEPGRDAVADSVERVEARGAQLEEEPLGRPPLRDEYDGAALDLERVPERRLAANAARLDGR